MSVSVDVQHETIIIQVHLPSSRAMSPCTALTSTRVLVRVLHMHVVPHMKEVSAAAQQAEADRPQDLLGTSPKEKLNSFNRGRAVNGRLI